MDFDGPKPNLADTGNMRLAIAGDRRFKSCLDTLVTEEREGVTFHFTPSGAAIFESTELKQRLDNYVTYARSFNTYLDDLVRGSRKPDDQYSFNVGELNGTRTKLGKPGVEGQIFNFPPFVVKETRSDFLERVQSETYIPYTQVESLMVMEGLRPIVVSETRGLVSVPQHYGVASFELSSSRRVLNKPRVELMIMERVGDERGSTADDVIKGKAYVERKAELEERIKRALDSLSLTTAKLPLNTLRDLGAHNLIVNPQAFNDATKPLFFLIDQ